jgi:hypothetical protein
VARPLIRAASFLAPEAEYSHLPLLRFVPSIDVFSDLVLGDPIPLLNFAFELIASAIYGREIIIGEVPPLLLYLAFDLFPVSFDAIQIHCTVLHEPLRRNSAFDSKFRSPSVVRDDWPRCTFSKSDALWELSREQLQGYVGSNGGKLSRSSEGGFWRGSS